MTYNNAAAFIMPFGKYKGKTFDAIAVDDLGYLDWMRGERDDQGYDGPLDAALAAYLDDPAIRKELDNE